MIGSEQADGAVFSRIVRRVEDILQAAHERERMGETLALDIDARFRLQESSAVQFQLASAILEEMGGLEQEEVVSELLSLGLAAVLNSAARAARAGTESGPPVPGEEAGEESDELPAPFSGPLVLTGNRTLN